MRRIIRNKATSEYLSADGEWVRDFGSAHDFENVESAVLDVQDRHLEDAELVLVMGAEPSATCDPYLTIS
jgi:hypothetical protein